MDQGSNIFAMVGMLVLMILVCVAAYYASRMLANHYQGGVGRSGNIKILERTAVGQNSWLILVQVGKQVQLLAVTQKQITCLSTFAENELETLPNKEMPTVSFKEIFHSFRDKGGEANGTDNTAKETEKME